jgi:hypothetical protein
MSDAPAQLDYAPLRRGWHPRRWTRRTLILLALAILAGWVVMNRRTWIPAVQTGYRRWNEMRQIARCMKYAAPADRVVWERDPWKVEELLKSTDYSRIKFNDGMGAIASAKAPQPWQEAWPVPGRTSDRTVVFLHERTIPGGKTYLVAIEYCLGDAGKGWEPGTPPHFAATVIERGSLTRWTRHNGPSQAMKQAPPVRIYFGQPDPADPSHFTIRAVAADGQEDLFDGWLQAPEAWDPAWEFGKVHLSLRTRGQAPRPPA